MNEDILSSEGSDSGNCAGSLTDVVKSRGELQRATFELSLIGFANLKVLAVNGTA